MYFRYEVVLESPNLEAFEILFANRHSGIITLKKKIDYETHTSVNVTVMATDGGEPPLNSTALVLVEIEDVNDNAPVWETDFTQPYTFYENESIGR